MRRTYQNGNIYHQGALKDDCDRRQVEEILLVWLGRMRWAHFKGLGVSRGKHGRLGRQS